MSYVPQRSPAAHRVAAAQNKSFNGCYIYLEGDSDVAFWKNHVDRNTTKLVACNGWTKVVDTLVSSLNSGVKCIGIIDKDFNDYLPDPKRVNQALFLTEEHDLEMMIYKSDDYNKVLNNIDKDDKIDAYTISNGTSVLDESFSIAERIAKLKIATKRNNLCLAFKHQNRNQEITYPDYGNILNKNFTYSADSNLVEYIIQWSANKVSRARPTKEDAETLMHAEDANDFESWSFLNGHDVTLILCILLKKKLKIGTTPSHEEFERLLYLACEKATLQATTLYKNIDDYAKANDLNIFPSNN